MPVTITPTSIAAAPLDTPGDEGDDRVHGDKP